ncbi:hypothetical protein J2S43_006226 [Catenuloplanes nepalensis]|uniref:HNH nuclease domain-containing protein n=1 Tax=Catenuloplanes nepalensis TaxID=587533 RepID=A0ABT9N1Z5_9ACTN|nr:HNH endonuclease [Catenuloplanes nepalensis]MDP9797714.1 hypothetical protein [Catenuloplanes nepalensis]
MGSWLEDIVAVLDTLGGTGTYDEIYAGIEQVRSNLPPSWKDIVRRQIQDRSSDSAGFKGRQDLFFSVDGLGRGVWGQRSAVVDTPKAADLPDEIAGRALPDGNASPGRALQKTYRLLRDTRLAREIKLLHRDRCQLCDLVLRLDAARTYSEAHHIIPVGNPHNGPDVAGNIIVLCPNHHALCDYGAIPLERSRIREITGHVISDASLEYHNSRIHRMDIARSVRGRQVTFDM